MKHNPPESNKLTMNKAGKGRQDSSFLWGQAAYFKGHLLLVLGRVYIINESSVINGDTKTPSSNCGKLKAILEFLGRVE